MDESITATYQAGRIELSAAVDWPDGTQVEVRPVAQSSPTTPSNTNVWPKGFFDQLRSEWGEEPFDRPAQGELEQREDW
ncbi:hypothetical protein Pan181_43110 [Aeoliella mucimassa]|uniref:Uncharacterized protein n=2 Tax=Aeoliella mucimassa TaxID=2527972 RepID=A0A518ATQ7_9BACT|nr:hypothetical protein Pan181_43110 [Aeoliella mucimassa]